MTGAIEVSSNTVIDSPWEAVQFTGSTVSNVVINDLTVINVGTFVFQLQAGAGNATVMNVVASGSEWFGVYDCGGAFDLVDGGGNTGWNTSHCGFPQV
jgi:hypothetical protein